MFTLSTDWSPYKGIFHLCFYVPGNGDETNISDKVIHFKDNVPHYVNNWIKLSVSEIKKQNLNIKYIVRALSSSELEATNEKPLQKLGLELASQLNAEFIPSIIYKSRHTKPLHTIPKAVDRKQELNDAYCVRKIANRNLAGNILFIDDVTTSGATANVIMSKILAVYPNLIPYQFAIAKTKRENDANRNNNLITF